jgi:multidrug resistance efflux pump
MSVRNKFLILLSVIVLIASAYYFFSTPSGNDLVLVGTVDSNQVVVSPQVGGRIAKLLVEEGSSVKQGDLIAVLDPAELEAQERAAAATIASLRSKVSESQYTQRSTKGATSSDVENAQARLQAARAQLAQAEATLTRVESDTRRIVGLAQAGVASDMEKVQAEQNLKAQQASVQALKDQVHAAQADLDSAIARRSGAEYSGVHPGPGRKCPGTVERGGSTTRLHKDLCPGNRNRTGACCSRGRSPDGGASDRHPG